MRILWWSNAPWTPTGYGQQTALFSPLLRDLGHQVAIGAFHGLQGQPSGWCNIPVYPGGRADFGLDMLESHYRHWNADLAITLMDTWKLEPEAITDHVRIAAWTPVDCKPLGLGERQALESTGAVPVAISRHGEKMMRDAGLDPLYVPHGVDTAVFSPPADRDELRARMGLTGRFVIGINAANRDQQRKGFPEQFRAFAAFAKKHPEALLSVHSVDDNLAYGGLDLRRLAEACGITDRIAFCNQQDYLTGLISPEQLASWYGCLDVLSNCSYGEGFGIPVLEAQACGTPVVVTQASAMTELRGPGWLAYGEPVWHYAHEAWWTRPGVAEITHCYAKAYEAARFRREAAREFALGYDAKTVLEDYWVPALASITERTTATS